MVARLDYGQRGIFTNALPDRGLVLDGSNISGTNLFDLQISGSSKFKVDKTGNITTPNFYTSGSSLSFVVNGFSNQIYQGGNASFVFNPYGGFALSVGYTDYSPQIQIKSTYSFGWSSTTNQVTNGDLIFWRDAAATFAQRNGVNAQTSRIYGTYTDASNYERLNLSANSTASYIQTENAGTGTARDLYLGANNSTKMVIAANGNVGIGTTSPIQAMTVNGNIAFPDSGGSGTYNIKCWGYNDVINLSLSRQTFLTAAPNSLTIQTYAATYIGTATVANILSVQHQGAAGQVLISGPLGGPTGGLTNALGVGGGVAVGSYSIYPTGANAPSGGLIVSGDVGIGTTTPAYKLEVAGSFGATTVNVGNTTVNTVISSTTISLINIALVGF